MNISKVSFKRNFSISPETMEHMHLGVEVDINEGEDPKFALQEAQKLVEEFYKESFTKSSPYKIEGSMPIPDTQIGNPFNSMIEEMEACTELDNNEGTGLLSFKLTIKNTEEQSVYNKKLEELTNKK